MISNSFISAATRPQECVIEAVAFREVVDERLGAGVNFALPPGVALSSVAARIVESYLDSASYPQIQQLSRIDAERSALRAGYLLERENPCPDSPLSPYEERFFQQVSDGRREFQVFSLHGSAERAADDVVHPRTGRLFEDARYRVAPTPLIEIAAALSLLSRMNGDEVIQAEEQKIPLFSKGALLGLRGRVRLGKTGIVTDPLDTEPQGGATPLAVAPARRPLFPLPEYLSPSLHRFSLARVPS
ncbi:hypothetical protein MRY87_06710 [bacterium]|nr:hypothetical protein [bacterium]